MGAQMSHPDRYRDQVVDCSTPGHDRDCALAMLNQARRRGGIDDIQVAHLLAIGFRAGEERGWHRGFEHARRYLAPRRRWWHHITRRTQ